MDSGAGFVKGGKCDGGQRAEVHWRSDSLSAAVSCGDMLLGDHVVTADGIGVKAAAWQPRTHRLHSAHDEPRAAISTRELLATA